MPEGSSFPFDFGFVPSTLGEDRDPLDVMVLMGEPLHVGCLVEVRLIGVLQAQQVERNGRTRAERPSTRSQGMSLSAFIRDHREDIIVEFAGFARTLMPAGADMTEAELRDHAEEILTAFVHDIGPPQTGEEQHRKSQGQGAAKAMAASGKLHADDRLQHGFTFQSVLAEFRALRATVLRLLGEAQPKRVQRQRSHAFSDRAAGRRSCGAWED